MKCLLCYLIAKSFCCPFIPAASAVCFREWSPTRHTAKSSLVHDKSNAVCTKLNISFYSLACIMDLFTSLSTRRAALALFSRSHLHLDVSVRSNELAHDLEFWQIQWHQNSLHWFALSSFLLIYGMLFCTACPLFDVDFCYYLIKRRTSLLLHSALFFLIRPLLSPARTETHIHVRVRTEARQNTRKTI